MSFDYSISTTKSSVSAGTYPAVVVGFIGLGKQTNPHYPTKPPSLKFVLQYRLSLPEGGSTTWTKTYSASWGPKASFFKDCVNLFTGDEIKSGMLNPTALIGRPAQLVFNTVPQEDGEKTALIAVMALPKTLANAEVVKALRAEGTFSMDAAKGERPAADVLATLPDWLKDMIAACPATAPAPVQPPPSNSPTLAMVQAANRPAAAPEELNDSLDDLSW